MTNTLHLATHFSPPDNPQRETPDALTDLELEVARRADELAKARPLRTALNLHCWLLAEAEVLAARAVASAGLAAPSPLVN